MCDTPINWIVDKKKPVTDDTTHIYVCPECPFIGFEYLNNKNVADLFAHLNRDRKDQIQAEAIKIADPKGELKHAIDTLYDMAEKYNPNYYSSDDIALVDDTYKKFWN